MKTVDGEGNASRFWYNSRGMMEKAVTGDTVTEYSYDREGRMTESAYGSIKSPERIRNKYEVIVHVYNNVYDTFYVDDKGEFHMEASIPANYMEGRFVDNR